MIMRHGNAGDWFVRLRRFRHQPCLPQQLIALQDQLLIPCRAEGNGHPPLPFPPRRRILGAIRPRAEPSA